MRKWKLLLSTFGVLTPLAIATPFIVSCSGKERTLNIEPPTKFINVGVYWDEFNYWDREIYLWVKMYRNEDDYRSGFSTFQIGRKDKVSKEWTWLNNDAIYQVKMYYMQAIDAGYTPIRLYSF